MNRRPRRAYLDSNVFIYGVLEECNSRLVLFLAQLGEFEVVVSELVVEEVGKFFRENFSREAGYLAKRFVESLASKIIIREEMRKEVKKLRRNIRQKDVENLAALRSQKIPHLVSYDEDYQRAGVREYVTPKSFVKLFDMKPYETEY